MTEDERPDGKCKGRIKASSRKPHPVWGKRQETPYSPKIKFQDLINPPPKGMMEREEEGMCLTISPMRGEKAAGEFLVVIITRFDLVLHQGREKHRVGKKGVSQERIHRNSYPRFFFFVT